MQTLSLSDPKLIIQELWNLTGMVKFSLEHETRWIEWKGGLEKTPQVSLNSWYGFQHLDISRTAYGAVVYFVLFSKEH